MDVWVGWVRVVLGCDFAGKNGQGQEQTRRQGVYEIFDWFSDRVGGIVFLDLESSEYMGIGVGSMAVFPLFWGGSVDVVGCWSYVGTPETSKV